MHGSLIFPGGRLFAIRILLTTGLIFATASVCAQQGPVQLKSATLLSAEPPPFTASTDNEDSPVGFVKTVSGAAFVVTHGKSSRAFVGSAVVQGSILKTGAGSAMGVTFKDNTLMSFGPDTELRVDEYLYSPTEGKLKFGSRLVRGTLNYVSGVIAKLRPDGVTVNTPTGMIGVRGTQFVAKVFPENP
jgi:hypothetical protein